MVPACYPSKISSTTGLREAVVFALSSVTGLVRWTDYIPVKLVASADAALEGRTDAGGFIPMDMLVSNTGLMGWVDYLPVYVDNSATDAWAITATGFIPYAPSGGVSVPSLPQSANIVFNMKADSLVLSDGATVSTWTDSSANALAFTGTGTFKTNQLGGKPCVRFSGAGGQYMTATRAGTALDTAMTSRICTVMIVGKSFGTNSLGTMFGSHAGGNNCFFVIDGAQTSSAIGRYANNTNFCAPAVNASNMFVSAVSSVIPYTAGSGTGLERQYLNGTCVSSNVAGSPVPNQTTFAIAAASAGSLRAAVDIFDIVVWDRTLTPTEVFEASDYFYDKYSQTKPWASVSNITIFDGDSITAGVGATTVGGYPYKSAQSLGLTYGQWTNLGIGGIKMSHMITKLPEWNGIGAALSKGMRVAAFEYYNQKGDGAASIQTQNNSYATTVRGYANTKLALGTSTSHTGDPDATRTAVNAYYDINFATYSDAYVAIHNDANIGISGAATTDANVTYFSDGVHLKPAGYTVLASLFTTGLQAIP